MQSSISLFLRAMRILRKEINTSIRKSAHQRLDLGRIQSPHQILA